MRQVMEGKVTPVQLAAILMGLHVKTESVSEIAAAASVMREFSTKVDATGVDHLVDTCGTGGDKAHTFNISTTAAFVAAAGGARVAKHGDRAVSSQSGSADVLEVLGVNLALTPDQVGRCIREVGAGLHVRAQPPSGDEARRAGAQGAGHAHDPQHPGPAHQPGGRAQPGDGRLPRAISSASRRACSRCSAAGTCSRSTGTTASTRSRSPGPTYVAELKHDFITEYTIEPSQFGIDTAPLEAIQAKDKEESRARVLAVLANEPALRATWSC